MTDAQLLQSFASDRDESAFRQFVNRHAGLVYSSAVRHLGGRHADADDIVQQVFSKVAQKAGALSQHTCLAGWLYITAKLFALEMCRRDKRRLVRESEFPLMSESTSTPDWDQVRPVLDASLNELESVDKESILLRFFGQRSFREIGEQLGLSEGAAQKRVERALARLHTGMLRRGIGCSATALGASLGFAHCVPSAELIGSISSSAASASSTFAIAGTAKIWWISAAIAGAGVACAAVALVELPESRAGTPMAAVRAASSESPAPPPQAKPATHPASAVSSERVSERPAVTSSNRAAPPPVQLADYVVLRGDTAPKIADKTGTSLEELMLLNPETQWGRLRVGQIVHVVMPK